MANYPTWNVRLRHEWLATPSKGKRVKRRGAKRIGLQEARERNKKNEPTSDAPAEGEASATGEATEAAAT
jgi:hypothetical protein